MGATTKVFDSTTSTHWDKDEELNRLFLQLQERYAHHRLHAQGFLFLNDVLEPLGLKKTTYGQLNGWIFDENGYIDFGIKGLTNFSSVLLKFNVDGEIWNRVDEF